MGLIDNSSILMSIKKLLNVEHDDPAFDTQIGMAINAEFMTLYQLGVGPEGGFSITDADTKWTDFSTDKSIIETVKMLMGMKVRMIFDPPASSIVAEALNSRIAEYEWRLVAQIERNQENSSSYDVVDDNLIIHNISSQVQQNTPRVIPEPTPNSPSTTSYTIPSPITQATPIVHKPDPFEDKPQEEVTPNYAVRGETLQLFGNLF